jgi:hypothetical protein
MGVTTHLMRHNLSPFYRFPILRLAAITLVALACGGMAYAQPVSPGFIENSVGWTPSTNLAQLSLEQQVSELIFQLRDQTGWQSMNPGRCSVFHDPHGSTNTPAHQLARLGYAAVPQLIAALDDSTPSRASGWWKGNILTIGDCAEQILEGIAGRDFLDNQLSGYMSDTNQLAATRKAVESWWAEARVKGEKEMLVEGVTSPSHDTPAQAGMLCERYPEIAFATLVRGAQATTDSWVHATLVEKVSRLNDPQVTDFLNHEIGLRKNNFAS